MIMPTKRDYYEILGVEKTALASEIKSAYRKMALEFHPDRNKAADAEEKFKEINEAYEVLSNAEKRQAYDQFGHTAFDPRAGGFGGFGQAGQTGRAGPFTYTYTNTGGNPFGGFGVDFSDPFEIFEQFFGGGGSPFGGRVRKTHYSLTIEFLEAAKGTEKTLIHQGREYAVKIPAGANDGTRIQFHDFVVSLNVKADERFKRDGYDVFVDEVIPLTVAVLGGQITVPTIEDEVTLKVRPGTQPNSMIRLRGKGIQHVRGSGRGDEYIRLVVEIPKDLTRDQRKIFKRLDEVLK
jgi:DnaJ-class molecular chaperone